MTRELLTGYAETWEKQYASSQTPSMVRALFAFCWKSFDDLNTLSITETIYPREIRSFG